MRVPVGQAAARKVARRRRGHFDVAEARGLAPVELADAIRRHPPSFQMRAGAEGNDEDGAPSGREPPDRRHVEMVVVIVRDEHGVELGKILESDRRREKPPGPDPGRRRDPIAPDRVGEEAAAVDLDERGGVSEPRQPQAGLGRRGEVRGGAPHDGNRPRRVAFRTRRELETQGLQDVGGTHRERLDGVAEASVHESGRAAKTFEPFSARSRAERREPAGRTEQRDRGQSGRGGENAAERPRGPARPPRSSRAGSLHRAILSGPEKGPGRPSPRGRSERAGAGATGGPTLTASHSEFRNAASQVF